MIDPTPKAACPGWTAAERHLCKSDPVLARIIRRVGRCTIAPRRDYFAALCQSIINQQISAAAGATVYRRFKSLFPRRRPSPVALLLVDDATLRSAGLSRQKASYLRGLAEAFAGDRIPVRRFRSMSDDEVIESLIALKGIGRWTAEMFLMFVLNRTDVLPVDDLGLRSSAHLAYKLKGRPAADELRSIAERWRPYRSVASWYLWRHVDGKKSEVTVVRPKNARRNGDSRRRKPAG